jgi:hypothetical protein
MADFNISPLFRSTGPNPMAFERREADLTGVVDPFAAAATALTQGLLAGEQVMRDRAEADRAFQLQQAQFSESVRQFDDQHALAVREADNYQTRHQDSMGLAYRQQSLNETKWETEKQGIMTEQEIDNLRLGEMQRAIKRRGDQAQRFRDITNGTATARITRYGYKDDPYMDFNTARGIGHANNKLKAGVTVALGAGMKKRLGLGRKQPANLIVKARDPATGEVMWERTFEHGDTISKKYDDQNRLDIYDPSGEFAQFDGMDVTVERADGYGPAMSVEAQQGFQGPQQPDITEEEIARMETEQAQQRAYLSQYEQLETFLRTPGLDPEVAANAQAAQMELEQQPSVMNELNRRDANEFALTYLAGKMRGPTRQQFLDYVGSLNFRLSPDRMSAIAQGILEDNIVPEIETRELSSTAITSILPKFDTAKVASSALGAMDEYEASLTDMQKQFFGPMNRVKNMLEKTGISQRDAEQDAFTGMVSRVINGVLKERSGAAVSAQEYERFLNEVGSFEFSSFSQFKTKMSNLLENVVGEYESTREVFGAQGFDMSGFPSTASALNQTETMNLGGATITGTKVPGTNGVMVINAPTLPTQTPDTQEKVETARDRNEEARKMTEESLERGREVLNSSIK